MITGINHVTLAVSDINKSVVFYKETLGLKLLHQWDKGAYFLAGDFWFCLNVDKNIHQNKDCSHVAFSVANDSFVSLDSKIRSSGSKIWKENISEGQSLYFCDLDDNKLEIHVGDWKSRLESMKSSNLEVTIS